MFCDTCFIHTVQRDLRGRSLSASSAPNLGSLSNTWSGSDQSPASGAPGMGAVIRTKLQLVDLAGSECVGKCQAELFPLHLILYYIHLSDMYLVSYSWNRLDIFY